MRIIDNIMENCKRKLLAITPWTRSIISSIETWPKCHVFSEWVQNNLTQKNCAGCHQPGISVRFLLFGEPYNPNTMQTISADARIVYEKVNTSNLFDWILYNHFLYFQDIVLCRICAARADIFHKIAHEKFNLFINCSQRVTQQQQEFPDKTSTEILNDLLAEHNWIDEVTLDFVSLKFIKCLIVFLLFTGIPQYAKCLGWGRESGATETFSRSIAVVIDKNIRHCDLELNLLENTYIIVYNNAAINSMSC